MKRKLQRCTLTHFWLLFPFYTPWKHQKTKDFLLLLRDIKQKHWSRMGSHPKTTDINSICKYANTSDIVPLTSRIKNRQANKLVINGIDLRLMSFKQMFLVRIFPHSHCIRTRNICLRKSNDIVIDNGTTQQI